MKPQHTNKCSNNKKLKSSFIVNKDENREDWNLTDELLGENTQVNHPISIENLNENMQRTTCRTKRSTYSFDAEIKFKNWSSVKRSSFEFNWEMINFGKFKSSTMKKSSLLDSHCSLTKRSLKDDISYLLRWLINEKKKNIIISEQEKDDQGIFVTMNDIAAVDNE